MCHRFPYEEPSETGDSDHEEQGNGVDVEQAVQAQGHPVSIISYAIIALLISLFNKINDKITYSHIFYPI